MTRPTQEDLAKFLANGGAQHPGSKKKVVQIQPSKEPELPDYEREDALKFISWAGSPKAAEQWMEVMAYLAESTENSSIYAAPFQLLDFGLLESFTVRILNEMGVKSPKRFPAKLKEAMDCDWDPFEENPYTYLITRIYETYISVHSFYAMYIDELIEFEDQDFDSWFENIQPCLLELAASKLTDPDLNKFAPNFGNFRYEIQDKYKKWLTALKAHSVHMGRPLRAEIMDLVYADCDQLDVEVEETVHDPDSHPDIYMNELLTGMREIREILPQITEHLGIKPETEAKILHCAFCGKSQHEVKKLVAGPATVCICNACVDVCVDTIAEEQTEK